LFLNFHCNNHSAYYTNTISLIVVFLSSFSQLFSQYGCTLLYKAVGRGNIPLAKDLIKRGANVNIKNLEGNTPLLFALGRGYRELALLLIDAGADIDAKDRVRIPFVAVRTVSVLPTYLIVLSERW
jgi:ankyrin repeat protein